MSSLHWKGVEKYCSRVPGNSDVALARLEKSLGEIVSSYAGLMFDVAALQTNARPLPRCTGRPGALFSRVPRTSNSAIGDSTTSCAAKSPPDAGQSRLTNGRRTTYAVAAPI